jgi:hypothetical protein
LIPFNILLLLKIGIRVPNPVFFAGKTRFHETDPSKRKIRVTCSDDPPTTAGSKDCIGSEVGKLDLGADIFWRNRLSV